MCRVEVVCWLCAGGEKERDRERDVGADRGEELVPDRVVNPLSFRVDDQRHSQHSLALNSLLLLLVVHTLHRAFHLGPEFRVWGVWFRVQSSRFEECSQ